MNQKLKSIVKRNKVLHTFAQILLAVKAKLALPIRGRGNRIINKGVFLQVRIDINGNNNIVDIAEGAFLTNMTIYIRGNNNLLRIGAYCKVKGGCVWFEDDNGQVIIGDHTSIESAHLAVTEPGKRITIGEDCMLSAGIDIRTGDSHSILDTETGKRINYAQDVTIGNHVWIGLNAVLLKGVSIGNNSIISTNAVVTQAIPDHSIAAGVPAKIIKSNVDWLRERTYETE
ncbi:acyltransferase [Spirosoma linguale]|uniref:Acetyltransferase (Isoleucine patch superfamily)-like protein n=1 Tax=Spirosoma linguale (strain ATCC 33905 / DSM 74 / LMG 10896 / Claus 1) TaxID=504472 RepID=D2QH17_SPILD|nr:Acetyltransferase (isoleucine patch superfamily)- like protein [Spirosoma linguale DSM 74]